MCQQIQTHHVSFGKDFGIFFVVPGIAQFYQTGPNTKEPTLF